MKTHKREVGQREPQKQLNSPNPHSFVNDYPQMVPRNEAEKNP